MGSWGVGTMDGALVAIPGAGVADDRPAVAAAGVSGTVSSEGTAGNWKESRAWKAVVRIALKSNMLFCCRFESLGAVAKPRAAGMPSVSWVSGAVSPS